MAAWYELQRKAIRNMPDKSATWVTITVCQTGKPCQFDTHKSVSTFAVTFAKLTVPKPTPGELAIVRRVTLP